MTDLKALRANAAAARATLAKIRREERGFTPRLLKAEAASADADAALAAMDAAAARRRREVTVASAGALADRWGATMQVAA
jgi:hypothetical protein